MSEGLWAVLSGGVGTLIVGGIGTLIGAVIQYRIQRFSAERQERREIIETHLLQLQNSLESLYYRINNLRDWGGKSVMTDDYFRNTSIYILGRVLAHESLLVSKGVYAKLDYDEALKKQLKGQLHSINWSMDDQRFLRYYRMQLAEMLLQDGQVLSYTDFLEQLDKERFQEAVTAAVQFVEAVVPERLDAIRNTSSKLIGILETRTGVPSALSLADLS